MDYITSHSCFGKSQMYPRHPLQLPGDNAHDFGPFVTDVASVYKCFPPAVLKGLEGEKSGHVIFRSITFIAKHKVNTQMGPPNPKRRMGRSLRGLTPSIDFKRHP